MIDAPIKAILPYFGGKRTMAPDIVAELGPHTQYFEPFCGSMAVLFAKEPSQKETVNDLHGDATNLARVMAREDLAEQLYDRLQRVIFCGGILDDARRNLHGDAQAAPDGERAYWYMIASWMGRNGTAGTDRQDYQLAVRWTKTGGSPATRWRNVVESLPAWHRRLRNVVITRCDAFGIIGRFEDHKTTAIYVDPPYAGETRGKIKDGRGGRYLHEFNHEESVFETDDHTKLRDILAGFKHARVVVSYYDCPRIRELYAGWTIIEHTRQKHMHSQNGRGKRPKEAPEILILNGPSFCATETPSRSTPCLTPS